MIYIGIDDTDVIDSRGTGHLGRLIAETLAKDFKVTGVTRHQLLFDPRIPYTAKNSCAAVHIDAEDSDIPTFAFVVEKILTDNFEEGSDPGLAIASLVPQEIMEFGKQAKTTVLNQKMARSLAEDHKIFLKGLGGTNDGMIGALAAIGLAASGEDGRYIQVGDVRELEGLTEIGQLLNAGIHAVKTLSGDTIPNGLVKTEKLRPARRGAKVVLYVEKSGDHWLPLKID
ncbi:MAG: hypothetical protein P8046_08540 [Anaerolineales bacterium]